MSNDDKFAPMAIKQLELNVNDRVEGQQLDLNCFIFAYSGVVAVITERGRFLIPPEQGLWLPAKTPFQIVAATQIKLLYLFFENCLFDGKSNEDKLLTDLSHETSVLQVDHFLKTCIFEVMTLKGEQQKQGDYPLISRLIAQRIGTATPLALLLPSVKDQRLQAITSRQQKFPALKTDLVGWGRFVQTSSRTLSRVFKKETGLTYRQWKQMMAIHIAIIELQLGESIATIAKNLGYESSSAFIHMFSKQMNSTPSHFLKPLELIKPY
jgi:AraC-like DNA-binding protein